MVLSISYTIFSQVKRGTTQERQKWQYLNLNLICIVYIVVRNKHLCISFKSFALVEANISYRTGPNYFSYIHVHKDKGKA